jgi:hypothetical protein
MFEDFGESAPARSARDRVLALFHERLHAADAV